MTWNTASSWGSCAEVDELNWPTMKENERERKREGETGEGERGKERMRNSGNIDDSRKQNKVNIRVIC